MESKHALNRIDEILEKAFRLAGGRRCFAEKLLITPAAAGNWKVRGVPIDKCAAIERITGGGVTRKDLRPDDWQEIWPELASTTDAPPGPAVEVANA